MNNAVWGKRDEMEIIRCNKLEQKDICGREYKWDSEKRKRDLDGGRIKVRVVDCMWCEW